MKGQSTAGWLHRLEVLGGALVALVLFAMMTLVFVDVFARYLFSAPIPGGFEITELLMAVLFFSALPLATAREQHVTIGLIDGLLGPTGKRIQKAVVSLVAGIATGALAWLLWDHAGHISAWGDYTAHLKIPLAPVIYFTALMAAVSAAIQIVLARRHVLGGGSKDRTGGGDA